VILLKGDNEVA